MSPRSLRGPFFYIETSMKHKLSVFQYGSNFPLIDPDNNSLIDMDNQDFPPIDDSSFSSSDYIQISISGSGSELSSVSSTHSDPSDSSIDSVESLASLHSTIVAKMDVFFKDRGMIIPDDWSTYEILKQLVINDETLFNETSFLYDIIFYLSVSQNPCWVETAIDYIQLIQ